MSLVFRRYDVVRVKKVLNDNFCVDMPSEQAPRAGDLATILELYDDPPGYELECSDSEGITVWLGGFAPDDLLLELVTPAASDQ